MSETKFTPGEWAVVAGSEDDDWGISSNAAGTQDIAQMVWKRDAHLIAAAPKLYEKLVLMLHAVEQLAETEFGPEGGEWSVSEDGLLGQTRTLLAKARGEA